jgi:succinate-acetate transporter protein
MIRKDLVFGVFCLLWATVCLVVLFKKHQMNAQMVSLFFILVLAFLALLKEKNKRFSKWLHTKIRNDVHK